MTMQSFLCSSRQGHSPSVVHTRTHRINVPSVLAGKESGIGRGKPIKADQSPNLHLSCVCVREEKNPPVLCVHAERNTAALITTINHD